MAKIKATYACTLYDTSGNRVINQGTMVRTDRSSVGYPTVLVYLGEVYIFQRADRTGVRYRKEVLAYFIPDLLEGL